MIHPPRLTPSRSDVEVYDQGRSMAGDVSRYEHTVGRYMLFGAIGSGGMATVHIGRRVGAGGFARLVAIKRLHAHLAEDREVVHAFLDEARIAARVTHPNVVSIHDVVLDGDEVLLVMEYVAGRSLSLLAAAERAAGRAVPPAVAGAIAVDLLRGLHAAHEARDERGRLLGLVHRDVSPHNVLVGTDGVARVLDFGIAKALGRLQSTATGAVKGKLAYMAPERFSGEEATASVDVYAAAIVVWELLAGARYFDGPSDETMMPRIMSATYRPLAGAALAAASGVLERALRAKPAERHASASELASELQAALPIATHEEVAAWVQRVAAKELAASAEAIEEIEQSSVPSPAPHSKQTAPPVGSAPVRAGDAAQQTDTSTPDTSSPVVSEPRPAVPGPSRWSRARLVSTVLASIALVVLLAVGGLAASRKAAQAAPAPAAAPLAPIETAPAATADPEPPATPPLPATAIASAKAVPALRPAKRGPAATSPLAIPAATATATAAKTADPEAPTDRK